ncbi:hypothetical protein SNEBB_003986 [Seison nebaliae]|nr:hypothetical protein SNEBB_003986 [Seison nebaliae]
MHSRQCAINQECHKFQKNTKFLNLLLKDTRHAYPHIITSCSFTAEESEWICVENEDELHDMITKCPILCVFGSTFKNRLKFLQLIFPHLMLCDNEVWNAVNNEDYNPPAIRIENSKKNSIQMESYDYYRIPDVYMFSNDMDLVGYVYEDLEKNTNAKENEEDIENRPDDSFLSIELLKSDSDIISIRRNEKCLRNLQILIFNDIHLDSISDTQKKIWKEIERTALPIVTFITTKIDEKSGAEYIEKLSLVNDTLLDRKYPILINNIDEESMKRFEECLIDKRIIKLNETTPNKLVESSSNSLTKTNQKRISAFNSRACQSLSMMAENLEASYGPYHSHVLTSHNQNEYDDDDDDDEEIVNGNELMESDIISNHFVNRESEHFLCESDKLTNMKSFSRNDSEFNCIKCGKNLNTSTIDVNGKKDDDHLFFVRSASSSKSTECSTVNEDQQTSPRSAFVNLETPNKSDDKTNDSQKKTFVIDGQVPSNNSTMNQIEPINQSSTPSPPNKSNNGMREKAFPSLKKSDGSVMEIEKSRILKNKARTLFNMEENIHIFNEFCSSRNLLMKSLTFYTRRCLQRYLVLSSMILHQSHTRTLSLFILKSFDLTRNQLTIPQKVSYIRENEQRLFQKLLKFATEHRISNKHTNSIDESLTNSNEYVYDRIIHTLSLIKEVVCENAFYYQFIDDVTIIDDCVSNTADYQKCVKQITELVITKINLAIGQNIIDSISLIKNIYVKTIMHCLSHLQRSHNKTTSKSTSSTNMESISPTKSSKPSNFLRKNSTFAALISMNQHQRNFCNVCRLRESINSNSNHFNSTSLKESLLLGNDDDLSDSNAIEAFSRLLNAAYELEIPISTSRSVIKNLLDNMKNIFSSLSHLRNKDHKIYVGDEWRRSYAASILAALSDTKLAKCVCNQFSEKLKIAHDRFVKSLNVLETNLSVELDKSEEAHNLTRKMYAPIVAKFALESISFKDLVLYGSVKIGKEIGRGQYGVVYSCDRWGHHENLAVKSIIPPDDRHWGDLAFEIYYAKQIQNHPNVMTLLGSIVDYSYGDNVNNKGNRTYGRRVVNDMNPAVLLIMERMNRDLHNALKQSFYCAERRRRSETPSIPFITHRQLSMSSGNRQNNHINYELSWNQRMSIAIDVVEGLRHIHQLGLIHRDIKLRNVLLDGENRAKITDLGFCRPISMINFSIVGTPIHMAPEVFNGHYTTKVDTYAFGILFWFICANQSVMPVCFDQCDTKDQLWSKVKKGLRPNRLPDFPDDAWNLMQECWVANPLKRPHLGEIRTKIEQMMKKS